MDSMTLMGVKLKIVNSSLVLLYDRKKGNKYY